MAVFSTPSFNFYTFDIYNEGQSDLVNKLYADPSVSKYIKDLDTFIEEPFNGLLNSTYIIGEDDSLIGFISLFDYSKYVSLNYALDRDYRGLRNTIGETKGCMLLKETSDFIFKKDKAKEYVELFIHKDNFRSIKTSLKAGFINDDGMLYHKYRGL